MSAIDWGKVSSVRTSRWLPFDYRSGVVHTLPNAGRARVTVYGRGKLVPLAPVPVVSFLRPAPTWADARRVVADYFHRVDGVALLDSFPDKTVIAADRVTVDPPLAAPASSAPVHHDSVGSKIVEWGDVSGMAPLFLSDSGYPRSSAPFAPHPAVGAGHLNNAIVNVVPDAALVIAPVGSFRGVAPTTAPSDDAPVTASCDVASVVASSSEAPVTASCDVAPVVAPVTTSSAMPLPIPGLPTFTSSSLALHASASQFLSTPASAVAPGSALWHHRNRLARCDAVYTGLEDRLVARKVDVERLTAKVQSPIEQVTALRDQEAHRQQLLDSRDSQIASHQREPAKVCSRSLVSAEALTAKTHDCDQLRQNADRLRSDNDLFRRLLGSFSHQIETLGHSLVRASAEIMSSQSILRREVTPLLEDYHRAGTPESDS